jgi:HK97 family phage major capsid protein
MATTTSRVDPNELRNRFRAARRVPQLLEVRAAVAAAIRQTSDAMDGEEGGDSSAELNALFVQLKSLLEEIDGKLNRQATIDDLDRRTAGNALAASGDAQWDRQQQEFSITRAIAAQIGLQVDAGRERETSAELVRRSGRNFAGIAVPLAALSVRARDLSPAQLRSIERRDLISTTTPAGGPGGALIATVLDPTQFVDVLRPAMAVRQLGARVISDLTSNLNLPRQTIAAVAAWFAENTVITSTQEGFDDVALRPRHMGAIVEISRNMIQQSTPDVEAIVRNDLAQVLARGVDAAAIQGAGTVDPLGIITDPLCGTLAAGAPDYDTLVDLTSLLATANALEGSLGWIANSTVRGALLKLKDTLQRPYGLDLLFQGFPYAFTNLASGTGTDENPIVFGNWNDLVIGMWSELDLLVNPYDSAAYSKGNVLIRGAMTIDIAKRHPESFAWMSAAITTGVGDITRTAGPDGPQSPRPGGDRGPGGAPDRGTDRNAHHGDRQPDRGGAAAR